MMAYYFVKLPLYGIEPGRVERFAPHKAGPLMMDGSIEPYDESNDKHRIAPGAEAARELAAAQPQTVRRHQRQR